MRADEALLEALAALQRSLDAVGRPAMIIDGLAVIARGVLRQTVDIDTAAWRDRDRSDIERLLILHADEIDLHRVRSVVGQFFDALDEPARFAEFDALVTRALDLRSGRM